MTSILNQINHWIHRYFLSLLLVSYALAVLFPLPGLEIRSTRLEIFQAGWGFPPLELTLPVLMLSCLLFNAGLGIHLRELIHLKEKPILLFSGLLANLLIPVIFSGGLWAVSGWWHNPTEVQHVLVGLALIASMPVAGSSTAWSQNANGNVALSLGLVVLSTLLSPLTTPFIMKMFGWMTTGDYSEDLMTLASTGVNDFLTFSVVIPSLAGIFTRFFLKEPLLKALRPSLKLMNSAVLILLSYSNAAVSLPRAFLKPDWDFLILIIVITTTLCGLAFTLGAWLSFYLKASREDKSSLMFALGMNNNGTGLVLSSMALQDHPEVMVPIIFYNLAQQIIAGIVDKFLNRPDHNLELGKNVA